MMKLTSSVLRRRPVTTSFLNQRTFATLVLSEHFDGKLSPTLGSVLKAAS